MVVVQFFVAWLMLSACPSFSHPQNTQEHSSDVGRNCKLCQPGEYQKSCYECSPCEEGFYTAEMNEEPSCRPCFRDCRPELHLVVVANCTKKSDITCLCEAGFSCSEENSLTGNCEDCKKIPQQTTPLTSIAVSVRIKQPITSPEFRSTSLTERCQPPHCDASAAPDRVNNTNHTSGKVQIIFSSPPAEGSSSLAGILFPLVVIVLAIIILLCILRPRDEVRFKQALKFCNKGVREGVPNIAKVPTHQTKEPQPTGRHQPINPHPTANMGPVHVYSAGTVIFSLLNQFTGHGGVSGGLEDEQKQNTRDEESGSCPTHPIPSPNIHLSQEEKNGEMDCVFFPSQEQGKESHMSKEEGLL
ncbi:uncharacterized protein si:dkey-260g12.1 isoform X1 [Esox lucius]|uniref:uncharacterized protein si:dkey-260g12.1 isoform X1 n=1 Tax=Esox lucius TaxID=8010 RepID=UPI0014769B57|nr:uncharacterized protein si:dkey-260g12.1 isoform X1 [Esox lucius]